MEKKMILVLDTDWNGADPIGVANTMESARRFAINWLDKQYDTGEWDTILEEDGYESKDDLFHDMLLGMGSLWEEFNVKFKEIPFAG